MIKKMDNRFDGFCPDQCVLELLYAPMERHDQLPGLDRRGTETDVTLGIGRDVRIEH